MARQDNRKRPIVQARQDNRKRKIVQASESANSNAFYKRFFLASWRPYLWILAICFLIYGHTIFYDFTYLDDAPLVVDNSYFNSNISNLIHAFQKDVFLTNTPAYRPLLGISFIIDAQIGHTSPQIYHFSNILFHMLASCCLFLLLTQLKYHRMTAFLFTVGFSVHPLLAQSVAWIPGRNDSLLALFVIPSFIGLLYFVETDRVAFLLLHHLLFAAALFTKETAIVVPLLCLAYLYLIVGEKPQAIFSKRLIKLGLGWFVVILVWSFLRGAVLANLNNNPFSWAPLSNVRALIEYLGNMILPLRLSVYPVFSLFPTATGLLAIIALSALISSNRKVRAKHILFGLIWLLLLLLPTLALRQNNVDFDYLNHRFYLPMIGIIIILMEVLISRNINCDRKSSCALALSVIIALALMTVNYTKHFKDRHHFWTNAQTNATRASEPYYQLGYSAYLSGNLDRAESYYKIAVSLSSGRPIQQINYLLNLSQVYGEKGMMAEAEEYAKRVIALVPEDPKSARAYSNLGSAYYNQKRVSEAEQSYRKAISLDPKVTDPYYNLCVLYYQQKQDFTEAERYCNKVLELKNNDTSANISLIIIYYNQQRFKDAIRLANQLQEQGVDIDKAIPGMLKALEPYR